MNQQSTWLAGASLGLLGVALGAFGAHALRPALEASGSLETFELAVRYQFYHALALLAMGFVAEKVPSKWMRAAPVLLLTGVLLFSGSLYLISLTDVRGFLVFITPLGGTLMLAGWTSAVVAIAIKKT